VFSPSVPVRPDRSRLRRHISLRIFLVAISLVLALPAAVAAYQTDRVVLVIIDGLRYSEGLGDPARTYVPEMAALEQQGTVVETFLNDGVTYTARAVPAIWCGGWTQMVSFSDPDCGGASNYYSVMPSVFEYYRKGLSRPASDCVYVLKHLCSWKGSFDPAFGSAYWPTYHAVGSTDADVWGQAQIVLSTQAPRFMLLYLAGVDNAGGTGNWSTYLKAIATADDIVGQLWQALQTNPAYAGKTTLLVTNDHGRHTTNFTSHGDGCAGCRRIQFLAVGPDIRIGEVSMVPRAIPDIAPTIGALLGFPTPLVTGSAMEEIFRSETGVEDEVGAAAGRVLALRMVPNPMTRSAEVRFTLSEKGPARCVVHDLAGRQVATILDGDLPAGAHVVPWSGRDAGGNDLATGLYFVTVSTPGEHVTRKFLLLP
jgi:hypothetical protein